MKSYIKLLSAALLVAGATTQVNASQIDMQINAIRTTTGKATGAITGGEYEAVFGTLPRGTALTVLNSRARAIDDLAAVVTNEIAQLETAGMTKANATFLVNLLGTKVTKTVGKITATAPSAGIIQLLTDLDTDYTTASPNIMGLTPFNRAALSSTIADIANNTSAVAELFKSFVDGKAPAGAFAAHAAVTNKAEIINTPEVALAHLIKAIYDAEILGNADIPNKAALAVAPLGELGQQALLTTVFATLS
jgi:hypothetical protein